MNAHVRAQIARFARMTGLALVTQILLTGGHVPTSWPALWLLVPGTLETLLREAVPVKPLPRVFSEAATPPATQPPPGV